MKFLTILLFTEASKAFKTRAVDELEHLVLADRDNATSYHADYFTGEHNAYVESPAEHEVDCTELGAFSSQDSQNGANLTEIPELPVPGLVKIGYGGHWKKGIKHWVAFPMLGLVACKQFVDLGRMSIGPKNGACQVSFKVANKWYQLYDCNSTTGMPKYLLDEAGVTIASCAAKSFDVLCVKQGKIWGKGSCEDPPPDELGSLNVWGHRNTDGHD